MRERAELKPKAASNSESIPATRPATSSKVLLAGLILTIATCLAFMPVSAFADQSASDFCSQENSEASDQAAFQGSLMVGSIASETASNNDTPSESGLATQANTVIASGYCGTTSDYHTGERLDGKNMTWKLYDDYTLEISGTGMMGIYNEYSSPSGTSPVPGWYDYRENITSIVIDEGVEHIGPSAFAHTAITSITLPSSVRRIEQLAFAGCSQLEDVKLNVGLECIGVSAFKGTAVTSLFIPATVKDIDNSVFRDIDVSQLVIDPLSPYFAVEDGILYGDNKTKTVASTRGFSGAYDVPPSVTTIGGGTFESRNITSVTIPNTVTTIGDGAFNISGLTSIIIPDSVTKLGRSAFSNSPIVTAKIGKGLKDLGANSAFAFNRSLKNVEFSEGLEVVSDRSFGGCTALERIDLPASVRTIGENAFNSCSSLSAVTLGPNVGEIGKAAFANCPALTSITLPDSLTAIGEGAFYGTGLTNVVVPDSVTSIGANAFPETASVTVPDTLVKLEDGSYVSRDSVTELNYEVTYGQTEARRMLGLLNDFRSGDEAWYWNENDTEKVQASGLDGLVYDYALERTAMKRAAEAAILYSHTRPDGTPCFTAFEGSYSYMGENIAWGYSSAEQVMEAWKETNYGYSGQGHRRNMLSNEFNAVGIGHVVYNGMHVWAQDFGYASTPDTAMTAANDSGTSASVILRNDKVISYSDMVCEPSSYILEQGDVEAVPVLTVSNLRFTAGYESGSVAYATVKTSWQSEDSSVAAVADGNVEACASIGKTQLVSTAFGEEVSVPVTVARNLRRAEINLTGAQFDYTGSEITPAVSVTYDSALLKEGVDYVATYSDNVNAGTATVTVEGVGDYAGEKSLEFKILPLKLKSMTLLPSSYTYDGAPKNPGVTVKGENGAVLKRGTDYVLEIPSGRVAAGSYTYVAKGKGNYTGSAIAVMKVTGAPMPSGKGVARSHRLAGDTALDTMSKIVDAGSFPKGGTVVLATSEGYWDALTAAGVAGLADAPVLMTNGSSLSTQTRAQIAKLKPKTIVICGGTAAVSRAVESQARSAAGGAAVVRCAGQTATGTAVKIFENGGSFGVWSNTAFVCTNDGYWDALAAAPVSYARRMPIFLTEGRGSISAESVRAMQRGGIRYAYIVGGEAAITPAVKAQLDRANIKVLGRLWGDTAIETSEAVAEFGLGLGLGLNADGMGLATTAGYWDALAGAALCGRNGSVLALADGPYAHSVSGFMARHRDEISDFYIFGGTAAVSKATESAAVRAAK